MDSAIFGWFLCVVFVTPPFSFCLSGVVPLWQQENRAVFLGGSHVFQINLRQMNEMEALRR